MGFIYINCVLYGLENCNGYIIFFREKRTHTRRKFLSFSLVTPDPTTSIEQKVEPIFGS